MKKLLPLMLPWTSGARRTLLLGTGASALLMAVGAAAQDSQRGAVEHFIGTVIRQTATVCPLASPSDQTALDSCRRALYRDSAFRNECSGRRT